MGNKSFIFNYSKTEVLRSLIDQVVNKDEDVKALKSIYRLYTKKNKPFASLLKNFGTENGVSLAKDSYFKGWLTVHYIAQIFPPDHPNGGHRTIIVRNVGDDVESVWQSIQNTIAAKEADIDTRKNLYNALCDDSRYGNLVDSLDRIRQMVEDLRTGNEMDKALYYALFEYLG